MTPHTINLYAGPLPAPTTSAFVPLGLVERAHLHVRVVQHTDAPVTLTLRASATPEGATPVTAPASARWTLLRDAIRHPAGVGPSFTLPDAPGTYHVIADVDPLALVTTPCLALAVTPGDPTNTLVADCVTFSRIAA
jgi:hypothetical protein